MLICFFDILSWLRERLWYLRLFLIYFLDIPLVDVLISEDLLKQDFNLFLMIRIFFLQLSLQELFLNQCCLLLALVRTFISWVNLLNVSITWLVLLLIALIVGLRNLIWITFVDGWNILLIFIRFKALVLNRNDLSDFAAVNSLWLVTLMFLVDSWRKVYLLLFWVNLVVGDNCSNNTPYIIFKNKSLENCCNSRKLSIVWIIIPVYCWNCIFRLKEVRYRWIVHDYNIFEITTQSGQVFYECIVVVRAMLPEQFICTQVLRV